MRNEADYKGYNAPKTKLGWQKMDALVASAETLFSENGFYDTSVADICRHAHTAVGTFYIYFETKTDVYRFLLDKYQKEIKDLLASSIESSTTIYEKERNCIKCFIKYARQNPNVYKVIWGSLSIDVKLFRDYYESFAKSYLHALKKDQSENVGTDYTTFAYTLMGISNFLGLRAIFEDMTDEEIDEMIDESVMPILSRGFVKEI